MTKGILILIGTFIIVGILHVVSLKIMKISEAKKSLFQKIYFYLYGAFLILTSGVDIIENNEFSVSSIVMLLCGLAFVISNFLGKLDQKPF